MKIQAGDIIYMDRTGTLVPFRYYTRTERTIRWLGRRLRIARMSCYHDRGQPFGIAMSGVEVLIAGTHAHPFATVRIMPPSSE